MSEYAKLVKTDPAFAAFARFRKDIMGLPPEGAVQAAVFALAEAVSLQEGYDETPRRLLEDIRDVTDRSVSDDTSEVPIADRLWSRIISVWSCMESRELATEDEVFAAAVYFAAGAAAKRSSGARTADEYMEAIIEAVAELDDEAGD